jgi:hypothetical protein
MSEIELLIKELAKNAAIVYEGSGQEEPLSVCYTVTDKMPTLRASERIRVVFIREHDEPQHPIYENHIFNYAPVMG